MDLIAPVRLFASSLALNESAAVLYAANLPALTVTALDVSSGRVLLRQEAGITRKGDVVEVDWCYSQEAQAIVMVTAGSWNHVTEFDPQGTVAVFDTV